MHPSARAGSVEAVDQWKVTVRRMASPLPDYEEADLGAASAASSADRGLASSRFCPWMLAMAQPWLPAGAAEVLRAHNLQPAMHVTYMTAVELHAPSRPLPVLDYRRIDSEELARAGFDIGGAALADGAMRLQDTYGYIAYAGGVPVSTATILNGGDCVNAICVATPAEHQRKGYAEAVLRHGLAKARRATGLQRMVLHATDAGYPIYKRMGFEPVVSMMIWAPAHAEDTDC